MPASLFKDYPFRSSRYDEMFAAPGVVRPHWQAFGDSLEDASEEALLQREAFIRHAIEADGISYNVYNDPQGARRPWELDMVPLIVDDDEWAHLSAAIAQRARLMNAILADLYGPQHLLSEGLLPPALVFGQQGFRWTARGITPPGGVWLFSYAIDIGRAPDGKWWVIADRTQGPSGSGYALQNRIIIANTFPDAFREMRVNRLANYFRSTQDTLARLADTHGESPLTVLLTPGRLNETYFEHAFLARYLGFPLVEGQDLTVRDNTVYMKTLRGLRRVHAIVRRLDDDFCDPLELRADSALGVPGLLGAIRAQRVLMANAIGSSVLESGALFGFLPAVCQRLLNEPLALPSVASWWCGERPALEYVIDHIDELVIKPAFPSMSMNAVFGHQLQGEARTKMIERLLAQPHAYVAQEWVRLAQAPVWQQDCLLPRSVGCRVFSFASGDGDYTVMPGALGRVASQSNMEVISMQRGGLSKDTWIRAMHTERLTNSMLKHRLGVDDLVKSGLDIPSRVGENLFWLGRYTERVEIGARLLRAAINRITSSDYELQNRLEGLLATLLRMGVLSRFSDQNEILDHPPALDPVLNLNPDLVSALANPYQPGSVAATLRSLSFAASQVRERLSQDNWHVLNRLEQLLSTPITSTDQALSAIDRIMQVCITFAGFAFDDMTRDEGWRFLILGRRIERLEAMALIIDSAFNARKEVSEQTLEWLLEVADSIVTYRSRYRRAPELLPVIDLVVFDQSNPHGLRFQLDVLADDLGHITRALGQPDPAALIAAPIQEMTTFDLSRLEHEAATDGIDALRSLLQQTARAAQQLSDEVQQRYFMHTQRTSSRREA